MNDLYITTSNQPGHTTRDTAARNAIGHAQRTDTTQA